MRKYCSISIEKKEKWTVLATLTTSLFLVTNVFATYGAIFLFPFLLHLASVLVRSNAPIFWYRLVPILKMYWTNFVLGV